MSKDKPKSLSELISGEHGALRDLAGQARLREDLSGFLRNRLPEELAAGFVHCNVREDDSLVVIASSPEWASRLRFETEVFKRICAEKDLHIGQVKVRVGTA